MRGYHCVVPGCMGGPVIAAHVRMDGDGGMGMKPGDDRTVPMCARHHQEQHDIGERSWWKKYRMDPERMIRAVNAASRPLKQAMEKRNADARRDGDEDHDRGARGSAGYGEDDGGAG